MGKRDMIRMMMLHDHSSTPKQDPAEMERERKEADWERRIQRLEDEDRAPRRSWEIRENNRYIDPNPMPRYPDTDGYDRRMPRIGFAQGDDWERNREQYEHGGASSRTVKMPRKHLTHDEAKEWTDCMINADGTTGAHWTYEQASQLMSQRSIDCDKNDFWAVLNMMYSDYCRVAKSYSVDNPNFYADMTAAFLRDEDAVEGKAAAYWECIAESD